MFDPLLFLDFVASYHSSVSMCTGNHQLPKYVEKLHQKGVFSSQLATVP